MKRKITILFFLLFIVSTYVELSEQSSKIENNLPFHVGDLAMLGTPPRA